MIALALLGLLGYAIARGANRANDFKYPYGAARLLWRTGSLRVDAQPRYPITFHVLLAPLASLEIEYAAAIWAVASVAAVLALPWVLARLTGLSPRSQALAWFAVAPFFIDAIVMGQSDPINLLLVTSGLLAARNGRGAAGALLVGLAGLIKILPLFQWATIVARGHSRGVWAGIGLTTLAAPGLVALAVGWGPAVLGFRAQADWISHHEKPWHLVARGGDLRPNNESLPIVLARTLGAMPEAYRPPQTPVLARLPLNVLWATWGALLLALGGVWLVASHRANRLPPARAWLGTFALTSILMLAVSPICWHHYFLWTLPAALFFHDRARFLVIVAVISLAGSASQTARACGIHMGLALLLFMRVAFAIHREAVVVE